MLTTHQITTLLAPPLNIVPEVKPKGRAEKILDYFYEHGTATCPELCKAIGASDTLVNKIIRELIRDRHIETEIVKRQYRNSVGGITTASTRTYRLIK